MTRKRLMTMVAGALAALLVGAAAYGQGAPARLVPFQARLTDASNQPLADGVYALVFRIYDTATGGTQCWTESHSTVSVIGGQVNVLLGSLTSLDDPNPMLANDAISFNPDGVGALPCQGPGYRFLGIAVGQGGQEMVPRQQLVPSFHARRADISDAVKDFGVTTNMLANNAVTSGKIADSAVTRTQLADGAVGGNKVDVTSISNLTGDNIQNGTIQGADIAAGTNGVAFANLAQDVVSRLVPAGSVTAFAGATPPSGWLLCDGSAVSRSTNAALFAAIGSAHGSGDGSTTFNLPDYRGRFLRGVDGVAGRDPDTASRTAMNPGGLPGNAVGSVQLDAFASHHHNVNGVNSTSGTGIIAVSGSHGADNIDSGILNTGGNETRPKNAFVNWIIKN